MCDKSQKTGKEFKETVSIQKLVSIKAYERKMAKFEDGGLMGIVSAGFQAILNIIQIKI